MATTGVEAESDTAKLIKAMAAANKKSSNDEDKGKITDKDFPVTIGRATYLAVSFFVLLAQQ